MFNLVVLTGRLTADAELRHTSNSVPVTSFQIAVNRSYKAGEEPQTDFINIVAWRQTAEFVTKYFKKGSLIGIEGSLQTRKYTEKDSGKQRTVYEVVANNVQFVEGKRKLSEDVPTPNFSNYRTNNSSNFENSTQGNFEEVAPDEDLPF